MIKKTFCNTIEKSFLLLFLFSFLLSANPLHSKDTNRVLYLAGSGKLIEAINLYQQQHDKTGQHNFEILQQLAISILEQGARSCDPESVLLSTFGAGITLHERALPILEEALSYQNPQIQLIALNFLSQFQDKRADELINRALRSNSLLIRFEAAHILATKKHPNSVDQIQCLMCKLDPKLKVLFPRLLAVQGDAKAMALFRRLMNDNNRDVRIEAILSAAASGRDDLLPEIRRLASQCDVSQQEACSVAFGQLKDSASIPYLQKLTLSSSPNVTLAARQALYRLGKLEEKFAIEQLAKKGNLIAISMLSDIPGTEETLVQLMENKNIQVSVNAAIALLAHQDSRALAKLNDLLIKDIRDLAVIKVTSSSKGLSAWKVIPSSQENLASVPFASELSVAIREQLLTEASQLPEESFLPLAEAIFEKHQQTLIPTLVHLLEQKRTSGSIELLKKYQQHLGAPLIRHYCNLALYRLHEEGPYEENLKKWISQQSKVELIRFRSYLPWTVREAKISYQLTAEETSRLLVESYESLAQSQEATAIEAMLEAIKSGHDKNKFALAGLLFRALL